jgi:diguanylate cyclase (GGDEF)-like protein
VQLKAVLAQPQPARRAAVAGAYQRFETALAAAAAGVAPAPPAPAIEAPSPAPGQPLIYLGDHSAETAQLQAQLHSCGYRVEPYGNAAALTAALARERPAAVILDDRGDGAVYEHAAALRDSGIPALVIAAHGDFSTRLRAVRAGALGFYTAPVELPALLARLDQLTCRQPREPYRVLLVDDERTTVDYYAAVLERAGMVVESVSDVAEVLVRLDEFAPEVVVADIYMPRVSGIELAMVIRQQERYDDIPIVFLSAERNIDKQLSALGMGADDFLMKPLEPEHFVSALSARAQRARALRAAMTHDGLTGLLNHKSIKAVLEKELLRSRRGGTPLAVALLDVDHFKQINDRRGHPVGDQVLRALARLLQQRLRRSDHVGRYGGEEFLLILPDTTGATAYTVVEELRAAFALLQHRCESGAFTASFSGGVAAAAPISTAAGLLGAADKALYVAKLAGRDRIATAPD